MAGTDSLRLLYLEEQYEELTTLDENGTEPVFLVKDKRDGSIAVKKYVTADAALLYSRLCGIKSPYLAKIYETAWDEERGVIIEEYINGRTLREYREENGTLAPKEVFTIITELCEALALVHGHGLIHRDINPGNIMLSQDGIIKLIDFGIAREVKKEKKQDTTILGTVGYAAPEQFGFSQTDARTDIYALGVLMNVLLTGQFPGQQMYRGEPFEQIIRKCINIDPDKRFQTIMQLRGALGVSVEAVSADKDDTERKEINRTGHKGYQVAGLPGFRTGVLWKNIVASLGYGFMILSTYIYLEEYTVSVETFFLEFLALFLYVWMATLVVANVADWDRKLFPFYKFPRPLCIAIRVVLWLLLFYWGMKVEDYVKYELLGLPVIQ